MAIAKRTEPASKLKPREPAQPIKLKPQKKPAKKINSKTKLPAEIESSAMTNNSHPMSKQEAYAAIEKLKDNIHSVMEICYVLAERKGYEALGYKTFKECVITELRDTVKYDYAHKLKQAGVVHMIVCPDKPMGEIPEGVLRPLHKLTEDEMKLVWERVSDENTEVTSEAILNAIELEGLSKKARKPKRQNHIDFPSELQNSLMQNALTLLKEYNQSSGSSPTVSKKRFDEALKSLMKNIHKHLLAQYEVLYPDK
ncbi:MAG TPA: hypothetical protein VIF37_11335 [Methylobacter sp.]|jgi:hypothetical protein